MASILYEYQPEWSHLDLFPNSFHDFLQNLAIFNLRNLYICYVEAMYPVYEDRTVFNVSVALTEF